MGQSLTPGMQVTFTYRKHYLLGGETVVGTGTVAGETIVGSEPAYIIKPADGSPSVHVRKQGVRAVLATSGGIADDWCTDYHCAGDCGLPGHGYQHKGHGVEDDLT